MSSLSFFCFRSSPKQHRRSPRPVPMGDDDSEDETGKLTQRPNSKVPTVDGIDNHDEFTRYTRFRMIQYYFQPVYRPSIFSSKSAERVHDKK